MFEDSLFSSRAAKRSERTRWIVVASVGAQGLCVAALLAVPLVWPETLPLVSTAPKATMISLLKQVKVEPVKPRVVTVTNDAAMRAPAHAQMVEARGGGRIAPTALKLTSGDAPVLMMGTGMKSGPLVGLGIGIGTGAGMAPVVAAATKKSEPLKVSSGVISGLLLKPIQPVYPPIAISAHIEGTVVVTATIDKSGRIVGLQVLSGPVMLRSAATEAVKEARYRPYLLNGEPTDVVTTISVNFRMGG